MLFNLKFLVSILAVMQTIRASAVADTNADVKVIYKTITLLDHPVAIPTGIEFNNDDDQDNDDDDDDDDDSDYQISQSSYSSYQSASSAYYSSSYYPSTLETVYVSSSTTADVQQAVTTAAAPVETTEEAAPAAPTTEALTTTEAPTTAAPVTTEAPTTAAAPTSKAQNGIFDSSVHKGIATFYSVSADNCGTSSTDNDFVCAISQKMYNTVANSESISEYCGHMINITYNGKTIQVKVVDSCESCDANHLDLSPAAFKSLADPDLGVLDIQWTWA